MAFTPPYMTLDVRGERILRGRGRGGRRIALRQGDRDRRKNRDQKRSQESFGDAGIDAHFFSFV